MILSPAFVSCQHLGLSLQTESSEQAKKKGWWYQKVLESYDHKKVGTLLVRQLSLSTNSYTVLKFFCFPSLLQFTQWVEAVIFVFSLDDELSFSVLSGYYAKMAQYRKYISDVPVVLVALTGKHIWQIHHRLIAAENKPKHFEYWNLEKIIHCKITAIVYTNTVQKQGSIMCYIYVWI